MNASARLVHLLAAAVGGAAAALSVTVAVAAADVPFTDTSVPAGPTTSVVNGPTTASAPARTTGPAKVGKRALAGPGQLDPDWVDPAPGAPSGEPATAVP